MSVLEVSGWAIPSKSNWPFDLLREGLRQVRKTGQFNSAGAVGWTTVGSPAGLVTITILVGRVHMGGPLSALRHTPFLSKALSAV